MARDVDLLISFKNSLPNPNLLSNWNYMHGVCEFQGVTCKGSHVSSLTIRGQPLEADFNSVSAHLLSLSSLESLSLHSTNLIGSISSLANCTMQLKELDLSGNNLQGSIYDTALLAASCHSLQSLNLSKNYIGKAFNRSSRVFARLKMLDLSINKITTNEDTQWLFSKLWLLKHLDLSSNTIKGTIPQITNCTSLQYLDLSSNQLTGTIPAGSLSNLKDLIMWQNNLHGEIPAELSSLKSLKNLLLDYNNLTGAIPDELVNCTSLDWISLTSNRLTGSIPIWIGKLEKLVTLSLGNNSFVGSIPPELGNCKDLVFLDLNTNQLNGSIPSNLAKQSGKIVFAKSREPRRQVSFANPENSQCHSAGSVLEFDGIGSDDIMRLPTTQYCNFTRFYFGVSDISSNGYRNNISMIFLDLSYNQLEGPIPIEISAMRYLDVLNLKHNRLSGPLPQELGGLIHLLLLDLSHNTFEGSIPSSFSVLSMPILDLSNNLLSGPIPELGSLITFPIYVFENNSGLCGLPLPPCNHSSIPKGDVPQQSSTNHESSQGWWIALGLLIFIFSIIGFIIGQFLW
ncbi:brassinosteroid LRR receptor kinase BRI1-like [Carex rostrata]